MFLPLEGVRVVDLTRYTAGPFCTKVLADYGADVIKIEEPGRGDPARSLGPFPNDKPDPEKSGLFLFLNTDKRSLTLDLKSVAGKETLRRLVRDADILVENFTPRVMPSLGLGYEALSAVNPRLVMTSISNFGQTGPYRDWEGLDLTLFAMGGNMVGSGDPEFPPVKTAGDMASFHVGYAAALATAVALEAAEARGIGDWVDVSFFEVLLHSIDGRLGRLLAYQHTGQLLKRQSSASSMGLAGGVYRCADGYFTFSAGPALFPRTARMIGVEHLLEDLGWSTLEARSRPEATDEFDAIFVPWMLEHTKKEIRDLCARHGVLGGPINTIADLFEDEHFLSRSYFQAIDHPAAGPLLYPGYPFRIHAGDKMNPRRPAPLLGQHTEEVLREIGCGPEEIEGLRAQGVV